MGTGDWSESENDMIVADYFAMLTQELANKPYSKTDHNRKLQTQIGRGRGSIEYKHQNISAILKGLGETWIDGYKPAFNYQASLRPRSRVGYPQTFIGRIDYPTIRGTKYWPSSRHSGSALHLHVKYARARRAGASDEDGPEIRRSCTRRAEPCSWPGRRRTCVVT